MKRYLKIHTDDNVVIALEDFHEGDRIEINSKTLPIIDDIPFGYKMAINNIKKGQDILKYGMSIGCATRNLKPGQQVHSHNMESNRK